MNKRIFLKILGISLVCLACLCLANISVQAKEGKERILLWDVKGEEETEGRTMRDFMKRRGRFYGESGNCMYTYINHKKEVKIIGFKVKAKKVKIPAKIRGKKVTVIEIFNPGEEGDPLSQAEYVRIPRYVKQISMVFKNEIFSYQVLPKLKKYEVSEKNKYFRARDGVLFTKDGKKLLNVPRRKKAAVYRIPYGVRSTGDHSFGNCYRIKEVVMPDTVERIGEQGFVAAGITRIRFSRNLKSLGEGALCITKLRKVTIPGTVKEVPYDCFIDCKQLKKVTIGSGVKSLGKYAFVGCTSLKKVIIPPSVKKFGANAFVYTSSFTKLKQLTIYAKKTSYAYKRSQKWKKEYQYQVKAY